MDQLKLNLDFLTSIVRDWNNSDNFKQAKTLIETLTSQMIQQNAG